MLGGGIPAGYSVLVVGPSGSGKTTLATQFIREGILQGEPGVIAVFEKRPEEYLTTAPGAEQLSHFVGEGQLELLELHPSTCRWTRPWKRSRKQSDRGKRIVIDSLAGFELALAPRSERTYTRLYGMVGALVGLRWR
jgi:circadian clock protein KaiC